MTQRRLFDFYADLTDEQFYTLHGALHQPGKLYGFMPTVSGTSIQVTAGGIITPEGVVIVDDAVQTLPPAATPVPGAAARRYTAVLQHINTEIVGGVAATWVLLDHPTDFYTQDTVASDQTVVFWLNYPGGSVALADSMIIPGPSVRDEQRTVHQTALQPPIMNQEWYYQLDANVTQEASVYNYLLASRIFTSALTPGPYPKTSYVAIPLYNGYDDKARVPYAYRMYGHLDINTRAQLIVSKGATTYTSPWVSGPGDVFVFDMLSATPNPITTDTWSVGPYSAIIACEHNSTSQDIYISTIQPLSIGF